MTRLSLSATLLSTVLFATGLMSCQDDTAPINPTAQLRPTIEYSTLKNTEPYAGLFLDAKGASTVDLTAGNNRLLIFRTINTYNTTAVSTGTQVDASVLRNMFANSSSPFSGTLSGLNSAGVQLRNVTASSVADAEKERQTIEAAFAAMAKTSQSVSAVASEGKAGKLGTYLVDEKGIEWAQIVQKSLIGAFQLDYIANVLLSDKNLSADNTTLLTEKNYTRLEQNWDEAYGILTANPVYGGKATSTSSGESFLGAYLWEYNRDGFAKIYPAFIKGRAALVNNDAVTLKAQATLIRQEMEKALASAAVGYLTKWKTNGTNDAARAHAIGEAAGFIYSLRFAKLNGADAAFSDGILTPLIYSAPNGFWGLTNAKIDAAIAAIRTKFNLVN